MAELLDLYTESRELTGLQIERGMPIPNGLFHLVVSVWIVNDNGEYLISQRHPKKEYSILLEMYGRLCIGRRNEITRCFVRGQRRIRNCVE